MGSGCLKPPAPTSQLNLSSLDQIFQQAKNSTPPSSNNEQKCLTYYLQLKQLIGKKGQLKKLCDYLSSHRDCICQTILHSYRILGQSKGIGYKYIALIVLDSILGVVPKRESFANGSKGNIGNQSKGAISNLSNQSFRDTQREYSSKNIGGGSEREHSSESVVITRRVLTQVQNQSLAHKTMQIRTISDQLNTQKFQSIYFSTISLLIKQDNPIYKLTLQNFIKYCSVTSPTTSSPYPSPFPSPSSHKLLHGIVEEESEEEPHQNQRYSGSGYRNRNLDKFCNENLVGQIMKNIGYHLVIQSQMVLGLRVSFAMLSRLKDTYFLGNVDSLGVYFDIWMSHVPASQPLQTSLMANGNKLTPINYSTSEIPKLCTQILQLFLHTCIQSYQQNPILQQLLKQFDKYQWKNTIKIQNLLFDCIDNTQFKVQFSRALFLHLLAYIGWPQTNSYASQNVFLREQSKLSQGNQQEQSSYTMLQRKWLQCYKMAPSFPSRYKNILNIDNKLNSLPKIQKWLFQYQIVNLHQLLMYSGNTIIQCFIFNLYSQQQSIKDKTIYQLRCILTKFWKNGLLLEIGNCIMREVKQNYAIQDGARWTLMTIWQSGIQKQKTLDIGVGYQFIIQGLNLQFCVENNVKIIHLMAKTFAKIGVHDIRVRLEEICSFVDSVYKEIFVGFSNAQCKIKIIEQFGKAFQNQNSIKLKGVFAAFLQKIHKISTKNNMINAQNESLAQISKIERKQSLIPENHILFLDFLLLTVTKILNLGFQSKNIEAYCQKIKKSPQNHHLQILTSYQTDQIPIQFQLSIFYPQNSLQQIDLYKQSVEYLKINKIKITQNETVHNMVSAVWKTAQSMESVRDSLDGGGAGGDRELEDVLDIIRG